MFDVDACCDNRRPLARRPSQPRRYVCRERQQRSVHVRSLTTACACGDVVRDVVVGRAGGQGQGAQSGESGESEGWQARSQASCSQGGGGGGGNDDCVCDDGDASSGSAGACRV